MGGKTWNVFVPHGIMQKCTASIFVLKACLVTFNLNYIFSVFPGPRCSEIPRATGARTPPPLGAGAVPGARQTEPGLRAEAGDRKRRPREEGVHAEEGSGAGGEDPGEEEGHAEPDDVRVRQLHAQDAAPEHGQHLRHLGGSEEVRERSPRNWRKLSYNIDHTIGSLFLIFPAGFFFPHCRL